MERFVEVVTLSDSDDEIEVLLNARVEQPRVVSATISVVRETPLDLSLLQRAPRPASATVSRLNSRNKSPVSARKRKIQLSASDKPQSSVPRNRSATRARQASVDTTLAKVGH
ncbi:unnamed protein product [Gongylonema pulchrum]|uniref:Uncharacterized protein n=1 Tax=Gongylonema pulchrum TaxID=637853 RepID=A0A183DVD0_9BILA|nr:unnamed protein product [Gongylonema pulchrum]